MTRSRNDLPRLGEGLFLTDGGIETTLIFHEGLDLPHFAAFDLLRTTEGMDALRRYYAPYVDLAADLGTGLVLEAATWRANADWGMRLGYDAETLGVANQRAIDLLAELRREAATRILSVVLSGCVGPRRDGYTFTDGMSASEAEAYHRPQIATFADAGADLVTAITMTNVQEAVGVARAAESVGIPSVVSFTVETDGRLPSGDPLGEAITAVDEATGAAPAYYMINCAHPTHFEDVLAEGAPWLERVGGLRANASKRSHAELDEAPDLDIGNPVELGREYAALVERVPNLTVLGGCCGTDHRHLEEIGRACAGLDARAIE